MAELTIRLEVDSKTGKKNVTIKYESEDDALPMEHEDEHRRLVNQLIHKGMVSAEEVGKIVVKRGDNVEEVELEPNAEDGKRESIDQRS